VVLCLPGIATVERVVARVSITDQTVRVHPEGRLLHAWAVSTATAGKITPTAVHRPEGLSRHHKSRPCDNAPLSFAICRDGDHAIHGTARIGHLGKPASHGCVRLDPHDAEILFAMVKVAGMDGLRVKIVRQPATARSFLLLTQRIYGAAEPTAEPTGVRPCKALPTST